MKKRILLLIFTIFSFSFISAQTLKRTEAEAKKLIDSLYTKLINGADFKKLSKREIENYCHPQAICRKCPDLNVDSVAINNNTDVPKHLKELGLIKNFKNDLNVEVFNEMTKSEWQEIDTLGEIKQFIEGIYIKIQ